MVSTIPILDEMGVGEERWGREEQLWLHAQEISVLKRIPGWFSELMFQCSSFLFTAKGVHVHGSHYNRNYSKYKS